MVGYTTNGEADDWGWGDEGVYSFTLEAGGYREGLLRRAGASLSPLGRPRVGWQLAGRLLAGAEPHRPHR